MKKAFNMNDYIEDIELNGLRGRMLNMPSTNKKAKNVEILYVYGSHSSLERWFGIAEAVRSYGNVCMPDLPGFGGMTPLYSLGITPDVDAMADYLAAFVQLRYGKTKKFALAGFSYGFLVVTRMLQKYPDLRPRVTMVISFAGFVHYRDFVFTPLRRRLYITGSHVLNTRIASWLAREIFFRKWFMNPIHTKTRNAKAKFEGHDKETLKNIMDFEVNLWRINDVRTRYYTYIDFLQIDLLKHKEKLTCPLVYVALSTDQYFDSASVEKHIREIFTKVRVVKAKVKAHAPTVIASADDVGDFLPAKLKTILKELQ